MHTGNLPVRKFHSSAITFDDVGGELFCGPKPPRLGEPLILLDERQYRPDFYLPDYDLFLEICGYGHMPHYNDRTAHKMRIYHKHNLQAIFIYYNGKGSLEELIAKELQDFGISLP